MSLLLLLQGATTPGAAPPRPVTQTPLWLAPSVILDRPYCYVAKPPVTVAGGSFATPVLIDHGQTTQSTGATSITLNKPTTVHAGSWIFYFVSQNNNPSRSITTMPTGFSSVTTRYTDGADTALDILGRFIPDASTAAGITSETWTITWGGTTKASAVFEVWDNVDTATPFDAENAAAEAVASGSVTQHVTPTITVSGPQRVLIDCYADRLTGGVSYTDSSGDTAVEFVDGVPLATNAMSMWTAYSAAVGAGTYSRTVAVTPNTAAKAVAWIGALKPLAVTATGTPGAPVNPGATGLSLDQMAGRAYVAKVPTPAPPAPDGRVSPVVQAAVPAQPEGGRAFVHRTPPDTPLPEDLFVSVYPQVAPPLEWMRGRTFTPPRPPAVSFDTPITPTVVAARPVPPPGGTAFIDTPPADPPAASVTPRASVVAPAVVVPADKGASFIAQTRVEAAVPPRPTVALPPALLPPPPLVLVVAPDADPVVVVAAPTAALVVGAVQQTPQGGSSVILRGRTDPANAEAVSPRAMVFGGVPTPAQGGSLAYVAQTRIDPFVQTDQRPYPTVVAAQPVPPFAGWVHFRPVRKEPTNDEAVSPRPTVVTAQALPVPGGWSWVVQAKVGADVPTRSVVATPAWWPWTMGAALVAQTRVDPAVTTPDTPPRPTIVVAVQPPVPLPTVWTLRGKTDPTNDEAVSPRARVFAPPLPLPPATGTAYVAAPPAQPPAGAIPPVAPVVVAAQPLPPLGGRSWIATPPADPPAAGTFPLKTVVAPAVPAAPAGGWSLTAWTRVDSTDQAVRSVVVPAVQSSAASAWTFVAKTGVDPSGTPPRPVVVAAQQAVAAPGTAQISRTVPEGVAPVRSIVAAVVAVTSAPLTAAQVTVRQVFTADTTVPLRSTVVPAIPKPVEVATVVINRPVPVRQPDTPRPPTIVQWTHLPPLAGRSRIGWTPFAIFDGVLIESRSGRSGATGGAGRAQITGGISAARAVGAEGASRATGTSGRSTAGPVTNPSEAASGTLISGVSDAE